MKEELNRINQLFESKNFALAETRLWSLYNQHGNNLNILKALGVTLMVQKKYTGSIKIYNEALKIHEDEDVLLNLSYLNNEIQELRVSIQFASRLIELKPSFYKPYLNIAASYLELREFDKAEKYIEKGVELAGDSIYEHSDYQRAYMDIKLAVDKKEEAILFAQKCLKNQSMFHGIIFRNLVKIDKSAILPEFLDHIFAAIDRKDFLHQKEKLTTLVECYFSLGNYYEKIDQEKSEKYFIEGNNYLSKLQRHMPLRSQNRALETINFFRDHFKELSKFNIEDTKGKGCIFIVGMPRSGTTLTESIISTAPATFAGGEKVFFSFHLRSKFEEKISIDNLNEKFFQDLGDQYIRQIELGTHSYTHFIDKMPGNFMYLGYIKVALPAAKFLYISRNPWDNATSLFKELYSTTHQYSTKFFNTAIEYANHEALMLYWESLYPESVLNIRYEDLVSNTAELSKNIWQHFELQGEYTPKKRENFYSQTASQAQVKKDIYQSSVQKKDFIAFKDEFGRALETQRQFWQKKLENIT